MREKVFLPFGMTRTSMIWPERFDGDYANGYDERGRSLGPERRRSPDAVVMTNSSNGEGIYKELLETLLRNTFTPIAWEGFMPYDQVPGRTK